MSTNKSKFIVVFDDETANELIKNGAKLVVSSENKYTFINDMSLVKFDNLNNKAYFTNTLCMS